MPGTEQSPPPTQIKTDKTLERQCYTSLKGPEFCLVPGRIATLSRQGERSARMRTHMNVHMQVHTQAHVHAEEKQQLILRDLSSLGEALTETMGLPRKKCGGERDKRKETGPSEAPSF